MFAKNKNMANFYDITEWNEKPFLILKVHAINV